MPFGLNLNRIPGPTVALIFHEFKHASKTCFLGWHFLMDKSPNTIYMRHLVICPTAIIDYSLCTSKPLSLLTISSKMENLTLS